MTAPKGRELNGSALRQTVQKTVGGVTEYQAVPPTAEERQNLPSLRFSATQ